MVERVGCQPLHRSMKLVGVGILLVLWCYSCTATNTASRSNSKLVSAMKVELNSKIDDQQTCEEMFRVGSKKFNRCQAGRNKGQEKESMHEQDDTLNTDWMRGYADGYHMGATSKGADDCEQSRKDMVNSATREQFDLPQESHFSDAQFQDFKRGLGRGFEDECNDELRTEPQRRGYDFRWGFQRGYKDSLKEEIEKEAEKADSTMTPAA